MIFLGGLALGLITGSALMIIGARHTVAALLERGVYSPRRRPPVQRPPTYE
jgi:hypothetical protein